MQGRVFTMLIGYCHIVGMVQKCSDNRGMKRTALQYIAPAKDALCCPGYRFPPDVIGYSVWLYYRFSLSLRMVEELLGLGALTLPTRRCGAGRQASGWALPGASALPREPEAISGTSTKWWSPSTARSTGCGARWTSTVRCSAYWCRAAANRDLGLNVKRRQHKGLNNRAENSHQPTRVREKVMCRFKSACHLQRFTAVHDQVANLFMHRRHNVNA